MTIKYNSLVLMALAGISGIVSSAAMTGKIVIDGQEYPSDSSNVIHGSGNVITDKRKLGAFHKLSINITADIQYIPSDSYRLELTADDNIAAIITSTIRGDTLSMDTNRSFSTQSPIHASIYGSSTLQSIIVNSSSNVNLQGLAGNSLEVRLDGTGDLTAQGKVQDLLINITGSSNINTKDLHADNVTVNADGSTDVAVTAHDSLNVVIDGVSDVTYYGYPSSIGKTINGLGEISAGD